MGEILQIDERGRLTIPKNARKRVGIEKFLVLEIAKDHLKLKPLRDPLRELKGSLTSSSSFKELRKVAEGRMVKEAVHRFRREH